MKTGGFGGFGGISPMNTGVPAKPTHKYRWPWVALDEFSQTHPNPLNFIGGLGKTPMNTGAEPTKPTKPTRYQGHPGTYDE